MLKSISNGKKFFVHVHCLKHVTPFLFSLYGSIDSQGSVLRMAILNPLDTIAYPIFQSEIKINGCFHEIRTSLYFG